MSKIIDISLNILAVLLLLAFLLFWGSWVCAMINITYKIYYDL